MSLKLGYKQTEVGLIPDDWAVKELGEIAEFANGKPNEQNVVVNGRYLLVTLDSINIRGELKTSHKQTNLLDDSLRAGDIVTVLSDIAHGNLLGLCGVIPLDHKYVLNQRMGRLRVHSGYDPGFIRLKVNQNQNHFKMRGQGTSQRHIYRRDFDCLKIGLPNSVAEQKAIAEALSDVDALIDSLEALLTKKRNIKTGVMQELLTGRTRLPGFTGDWKEVRLGELSEISMATSKKSRFDGQGKYIIADMGSVSKEGSFLTHKTTDVREDVLCIGDLVMPKDDIGGGQIIGKAVVVPREERYVLGDHVYRLRLSHGCPDFVRYAINSYKVNTLLRSKVVGSAQLGLGRRAVLEQPIDLPPIKEQEAIAAVLSDIDDEIEALEKRLAKTRDLKQGMAQELLTGRTRLV